MTARGRPRLCSDQRSRVVRELKRIFTTETFPQKRSLQRSFNGALAPTASCTTVAMPTHTVRDTWSVVAVS
jgi:hypothetical protein